MTNDSDVLIGDARKSAIDLNDMLRLGQEGPANDFGALIHECYEQYELQTSSESGNTGTERDKIINSAHFKAIGVEGAVHGIEINPERITENENILFRFRPRFSQFENYPYEIRILHNDRNIFERRNKSRK